MNPAVVWVEWDSVSWATNLEAQSDEFEGCCGGNNSGEDTGVHCSTPGETIDMECPGSCIKSVCDVFGVLQVPGAHEREGAPAYGAGYVAGFIRMCHIKLYGIINHIYSQPLRYVDNQF